MSILIVYILFGEEIRYHVTDRETLGEETYRKLREANGRFVGTFDFKDNEALENFVIEFTHKPIFTKQPENGAPPLSISCPSEGLEVFTLGWVP